MMAMRTMELVRAGKDSRGNEYTREALAKMLEGFEAGKVPVTLDFDLTQPPVGRVVALFFDGDAIHAEVELDPRGEEAADRGMELAAGGNCEIGEDRVIGSFQLTDVALTDRKVK